MNDTNREALLTYVKQAVAAGETYDEIRRNLIAGGWDASLVDQLLPELYVEAGAKGPDGAPPVITKVIVPPAVAGPGLAEAPAEPPPSEPYPAETPSSSATSLPPGYPVAQEAGIGAWLSQGWAMVTSDAGTFILATLVTILLTIITVGICGPPLAVGFYGMMLKKYDGQPIQMGDIFQGFRYFWSAWGIGLLELIVIGPMGWLNISHLGHSVGHMNGYGGLQMLVTWVLGTFLLFAFPYVADGRGGAIEAIAESIKASLGNFGMYLLVIVIASVIGGIGVAMCGIGLLFTAPLVVAILTVVYRSCFPARESPQ